MRLSLKAAVPAFLILLLAACSVGPAPAQTLVEPSSLPPASTVTVLPRSQRPNILLILVPLMPSLPWAIAVLLLRFSISQMDVPTRQSYTMAVVAPDERSAASGVTGIARSVGAALSPSLTGLLLSVPGLISVPFFLSGGLKIVYDVLLYRSFRAMKTPEEIASGKAPLQ